MRDDHEMTAYALGRSWAADLLDAPSGQIVRVVASAAFGLLVGIAAPLVIGRMLLMAWGIITP